MEIKDWTALVGAVTGTAALTIGVLNYLRDRPSVKVWLNWNMQSVPTTPGMERDCGVVMVANSGRRPVYLSHVNLLLPEKEKSWLLVDSIGGKKLAEGDQAMVFVVPHGKFAEYRDKWPKIIASVSDAGGRSYYTKGATLPVLWLRIKKKFRKICRSTSDRSQS